MVRSAKGMNCNMRKVVICVMAGISAGMVLLSFGWFGPVDYVSSPTVMPTDRSRITDVSVKENKDTATNLKQKPLDINEAIGNLQKEALSLASALNEKNRLLCWVMNEPNGEEKRAVIMETWGKRCHLTLFMTGAKDMLQIDAKFSKTDATRPSSLPPNRRRKIAPNAFVVYLDMGEDTYDNLWSKTRAAFVYIHEHFRDNYDWVLKVDDDSFVIIENLQLFLHDKKKDDLFYYGCQYQVTAPAGYASGGPGYIMSRVNADKLATMLKAPNPVSECGTSGGPEDSRVASCLFKAGVRPADTRDKAGRFRFSPFPPEMTINHEKIESKYNWFWGFSAHKLQKGFECCSDTAISFHYISPTAMRTMEYLIYYLHPFSNREIWSQPHSYEDVTTSTPRN